jgi:hypothetical protein
MASRISTEEKIMKSLGHILDRAESSQLAARSLEGWEWPEKSDQQWSDAIEDIRVKRGVEFGAKIDSTMAKAGWDGRLAVLHDLTSAIVRLGRVRHRANPHKAGVFDFVKPDARSRASVLGAAERLAEVWRQLDAAWVPLENMALDDFDLLVKDCTESKKGSLAAEVSWLIAGAAVDEAAETLDDESVAWYAAATAVFPEDTMFGAHIRRFVPTTTVPQPPPGQAEITEVQTAAGGSLRPAFTAAHGTRFTVLHKGPSDAGYKPVVVDTKEKFALLTGQAAGEHRFKVQASNSRGEGPESEEFVVVLTAELAG